MLSSIRIRFFHLIAWLLFAPSLAMQAAVITAHFTGASTIPVTAAGYTATGHTVALSLGYAPTTGTTLTIVRNTALPFINGTFGNLAQGQAVSLSFGGKTYDFVANYFGGTGNDLVLQWANMRLVAWGLGSRLGADTTTNSLTPVPVISTGVLAGKTVTAI
jgi:hypothetical protein